MPFPREINFATDLPGSVIYPGARVADARASATEQCAPRMNGHVSAPLVFTGVFTAAECDSIIDSSRDQPLRNGEMMYARPGVRSSKIAWLGFREDTAWLYAKIWQTFQAVNRWFEFELLGLVDEVQYTVYDVGDRFDWHLDTGGGQTSTRKLSMSIQLTHDAEYTGGDLQFSGCSGLEPCRRRGTIIVFPSFMSHRVTAIGAGRRTCLVAWAHGPVFR